MALQELVRIDVKGLDEAQQQLKELRAELPKVMVRAINRTIKQVGTAVKRDVSRQTGLKQRYVTRALRTTTAKTGDPTARITAIETFIPLYAYMAGKRFRSGEGIAGVQTKFGVVPPGGFFAIMKGSGHKGVFRRAGPRRLPIRELPGPPIPKVILDRRIFEVIKTQADAILAKRLDYEIGRAIAGRKGDA